MIYGGLAFALFCGAVVAYAYWSSCRREATFRRDVDARLLVVAESLKFALEPSFQDRALDASSISFDEEMRNRRVFNEIAGRTGFKWIYTLVEKDGKFYFSAPTVSDEEAQERRSWYFYPYDDIPAEFVAAFRAGQRAFVTYSDQWGAFRSVALPENSPGGRRYLACADLELPELAALQRRNVVESVATAGFFLLAVFPLALVGWKYLRASTRQLRRMNAELALHKAHLEELVDARTVELRRALDHVKALKGMLPMCSSCKRIRDDQGYWNLLEKYFRDHSDVEFSHSLCPECARRLYPDLEIECE